MKTFALTIAAAACLLAGPVAHAGPHTVAMSRRVPLTGLDLASPADAAIAYRRLVHAARTVCAYSSAPNQYSSACYDEALAAGVARLNAPAVTALHRAHG